MRRKLAVVLTLAMVLTIFSGAAAVAAGPPTLIGINTVSAEVKAGGSYSINAWGYYTGDNLMMAIAPSQSYDGFSLSWSTTITNRDTLTFTPNEDTPVGYSITLDVIATSNGTAPNYMNYLHLTLTVVDDDPVVPEPVTSVSGDATIIINPPDPISPYLIDPVSDDAAELFGDALNDSGLHFGEHDYTLDAINIPSENTMSMLYGYKESFAKNVSVFEVTCVISDFLLDDDTPVFNDFSLEMTRVYMAAAGMEFDAYIEGGSVYESAETFLLAKDEPVVALSTDAIGDALTNYEGNLMLEANDMADAGAATATITWEIGFAVEP